MVIFHSYVKLPEGTGGPLGVFPYFSEARLLSLQVPAEFGFDYPQHGWHVELGATAKGGAVKLVLYNQLPSGKHTNSD
jgi:hypothetical protein